MRLQEKKARFYFSKFKSADNNTSSMRLVITENEGHIAEKQ